ncbi:MAG: hypothetical protein KAV00_05685 [Phycisphaerae bacterium]|nr:hypothetical protein [Phycisphaerae bacterium]
MMSDKELQEKLSQLGRTVAPGESIANKVMHRIGSMPPHASRPAGARRIFMLVKSRPAIAAAAVIVIALMIPFLHFPGSDIQDTSIAWGDVVKAMNQVDQVHITAFIQDDYKDLKIDLYYRRPHTWRAQGMGVIQFAGKDKNRLFDIKEKKFVEASKARIHPMPPETVRTAVEKKDILDGLLRFLFRDKLPAGKPVKTSSEVLGAGVEVFDYTNDPKKFWVRIWVLRESRLPLRMKAYSPRKNESVLVLFDYSDPQPAAFFDPDKFLQQVKKDRPEKPREFYATGRRLAEGRKPRSPREIHKVQGGYKSPKLVEIVSNKAGDLLIVTTDPRNKSPRGGSIPGTYCEELWDNWGNLYKRFYRHWGPESRYRRLSECKCYAYYTPIGPVRRGEGKHTITLRYAVWNYGLHTGDGYLIVSKDVVDVPDPTAGESLPKWRKGSEFASRKRGALENYLSGNGDTLLKQLEYVESQLPARLESGKLIQWKMRLLEKLGEKEQAYEFFEKTVKDKAIAEPFRHGHHDTMLFDYMQHLWRAGRQKEVLAIIEKIRTAKAAMLAGVAGAKRHEIRRVKSLIKQSPLPMWLEAPQALKDFKDLEAGKPTPKVEQIARSEDGWVYMIIRVPDVKRKPQYGHVRPVWDYPRIEHDVAWKKMVFQRRRKNLIFLKSKGHGEMLRLVFDLVVVVKDYKELSLPWKLDVKVPPATPRIAEELKGQFPKGWFSTRSGGSTTKPASPYEKAKQTADRLYREGKYAQAIQWYKKALALPILKIHENEKLDKLMRQERRFDVRLSEVHCLIGLERLDNAWDYLDNVKKDMNGKKVFSSLEQGYLLARVIGVQTDVATRMIKEGRLDQAEALLKRIDRDRPDFRRIDNLSLRKVRPRSISVSQERYHVVKTWNGVDRAWWKLRKARKQTADAD